MAAGPHDRVVLGWRSPSTWAGFTWSGAEPAELDEPNDAIDAGAVWEGDELVTYNLTALNHAFSHREDTWLTDSD